MLAPVIFELITDGYDLNFQVRFLADLVNCHVLVAASVLQMFDNFVEVTLEDNIPQVCLCLCVCISASSPS